MDQGNQNQNQNQREPDEEISKPKKVVISVVVLIIVLPGIASSCALGYTDIHLSNIFHNCSKNPNIYDKFEAGLYVAIDALQVFSYLTFLVPFHWYYVRKPHKKKDCPNLCSSHWICFLFTKKIFCCGLWCIMIPFFFTMFALVFIIPTLGGLRDMKVVKNCSDASIKWSDKRSFFVGHEIANAIVLSVSLILRVLSAVIILTSIYKWDRSYCEIQTERHSRKFENLSKKYIYLYNNYIRVGKETRLECETLKHWFVVQYGVYLILVLIELVHIIKRVFTFELKKDDYDTWHSILYLVYDMLAFLIPYCMGTWLNMVHQTYYKKIRMIFLEKNYWNSNNDQLLKVLQPGCQNFENETSNNAIKLIPGKKLEEDDWDDYYKHFAKAQEQGMNFIPDFDFVPSIFGISIPLDSQGYIFTILLSIASIVFNFTSYS